MITIQNISKSYKQSKFLKKHKQSVYAVQNVSLQIKQGTCFTILGQSGSGKTTLGKLLLGIEKPDEGFVYFDGVDVHRATKSQRQVLSQSMQVVFQDCHSAVNPKMTIRDIIAEPLLVSQKLSKNEIDERVQTLLEMVGLSKEDYLKYPHQFSGGQLQRITIARAISTKPRLIILDESVNSLDVLVQIGILKLLKKLQHQLHLTYFFITHDLHVARLFSDQIAIMYKGKIVEQLAVDQIDNAKHDVTKKLFSSQLKIDCVHNHFGLDRVSVS